VSYLLDTNVLVWVSRDTDRLGRETARLIRHAPKLYFTPLSIAELRIKSMRGKLDVDPEFAAYLLRAGMTELPFTSAHAEQITRFGSLLRHDPMDRAIVAQAAAEGLNLITADRTLLELGFTWVIDANK
jgi:PIN domain nuclease of toxin-antitoxin system